jgi:hypothetical protein
VDKHYSLFCPFVSDEEKKKSFETLIPGNGGRHARADQATVGGQPAVPRLQPVERPPPIRGLYSQNLLRQSYDHFQT